jgi:transposase
LANAAFQAQRHPSKKRSEVLRLTERCETTHRTLASKIVKDYVASTEGKLEFHLLPGYAPELNPDEMVWNYMKRTGTARKPLEKGESLHDRIDVELRQIQENRALVRSFF